MRLRPVKNDPQAHGSATSYAKRYAYMAVLGLVADEDDDGNKASAKSPPTTTVNVNTNTDALKAAAKRAGVTSDQVDEKSREKYKKPLKSLSQVQVDELTDALTGLAVKAELGAK